MIAGVIRIAIILIIIFFLYSILDLPGLFFGVAVAWPVASD